MVSRYLKYVKRECKILKAVQNNYDAQREQPLQPSSKSRLISYLRIFFLKIFKFLVDLTSGDNFPHNFGLRYRKEYPSVFPSYGLKNFGQKVSNILLLSKLLSLCKHDGILNFSVLFVER